MLKSLSGVGVEKNEEESQIRERESTKKKLVTFCFSVYLEMTRCANLKFLISSQFILHSGKVTKIYWDD